MWCLFVNNSLECFVAVAKSIQHFKSPTFLFLADTKQHVHIVYLHFCDRWSDLINNLQKYFLTFSDKNILAHNNEAILLVGHGGGILPIVRLPLL